MVDRRKQHHLREFDYSTGNAYFVTICLLNRRQLFGEIDDGVMQLNQAGEMIEQIWLRMPDHNPGLVLDCHVVMPNHFHAIVGLIDPRIGREQCPAPTTGQRKAKSPVTDLTLHDVVRNFKSLTTIEYGRGVKEHKWNPYSKHLWQRSYWDHIIRDDADLEHHREYIVNNPLKWELDEMYPGE